MKKIWLFLSFLLIPLSLLSAETMNISTYYPAPFGAYSRIRLVPQATLAGNCQPGEMYMDSNNYIYTCEATGNWRYPRGVWTQQYDVNGDPIIVATDSLVNPTKKIRMGIGDPNPDATLEISGSGMGDDLLILSSDDNSDGDIMTVKSDGNVGIGVANPSAALEIAGQVKVSESITLGNTTTPVAGTIRWTGTDFEGYNGTSWITLSAASKGSSEMLGKIHSEADCMAIGSVAVDGDGFKFCKVAGGSCPTTWTVYELWSQTKSVQCCNASCMGDCKLNHGISGEHGWANLPVEWTGTVWYQWQTGSCEYNPYTGKCFADQTYIGCI